MAKRPSKNRGCDGKRRHETRESAEAAIEWHVTELGSTREYLRAYLCPHCRGWHVGHIFPGQRRRRLN